MILTIELIYQAKVVGLNPFQLVLVGSLEQFVVFVSQAPTGAFADMYSRRWAVVLGFFLVGIGFLAEGLFPVVVFVFVSAGIIGFGVTLVNGADAAWIADEMGQNMLGKRIYVQRNIVLLPRCLALPPVPSLSIFTSTCQSYWVIACCFC